MQFRNLLVIFDAMQRTPQFPSPNAVSDNKSKPKKGVNIHPLKVRNTTKNNHDPIPYLHSALLAGQFYEILVSRAPWAWRL